MSSVVPLKWRKYLLLTQYRLLSESQLNNQIHRYSLEDSMRLPNELALELANATSDVLYVVKLVAADEPGQLKNFRLTSGKQIPDLKRFLQSSVGHIEVWCCRTVVDRATLSVAGRLLVQKRGFPAQRLEQVWRASPRLIESFSWSMECTFEYPYLRASRPSWGWRYFRECLHIPKGPHWDRRSIESEAVDSLRLLEGLYERIEKFVGVATADADVEIISLEYKIVGREISIIDWDTANDRDVLRRLEHHVPIL